MADREVADREQAAVVKSVGSRKRYPATPDGRYFVSKGRLWRTTNPDLDEKTRAHWVSRLMTARGDVARHKTNPERLRDARSRVHEAKVALGERGPGWWEADGTEDVLRHAPWNTRYKAWWEGLSGAERERGLA